MKFETFYERMIDYDEDKLPTICRTIEPLHNESTYEIADAITCMYNEEAAYILLKKH